MLAQLAADDQRNQVRDADRHEDRRGDAVDQAAQGARAFHQQRARPPLVGILEREAGPDQHQERDHQQRVLDALERQHAQFAVPGCGGRVRRARRARNRARISLRIQSPPLCSSISPMVTGMTSR